MHNLFPVKNQAERLNYSHFGFRILNRKEPNTDSSRNVVGEQLENISRKLL